MVEGTTVELPVTIAVVPRMRQSEIAALKWSDYDGATLDIHAAVVPDKDNKYVYKDSTKSAASTRKIEVDGIIKERLDRAERTSDFISPMLPSSVLRKFHHLCDKNGLPRFTMHEQRHIYTPFSHNSKSTNLSHYPPAITKRCCGCITALCLSSKKYTSR